MSSDEFIFTRLADLHVFFRGHFFGHWQNTLRKKLGHGCVDALRPYARKRGSVSLPTIRKLEKYAAELGFAPLSSETNPTGPSEMRCPTCRAGLTVFITPSQVRGPHAR